MNMNIAVFVDGANLFYAQRDHLGWRMDLRRLLEWLGEYSTVTDALYYLGVDDSWDPAQMRFLRALPQMGYSVVTKPVKTLVGPNGEVRKKANLDIEIVLDMFTMLDLFDMGVLVSGDSDFRRPLDLLRTRGKRFLVLSTEGVIARELREIAGRHFVDLQEIRACVERLEADTASERMRDFVRAPSAVAR